MTWTAVSRRENTSTQRLCFGVREALSGLTLGLHQIGTANQLAILFDRRGPAEQIALHGITSRFGEEAELLLGLDALRDDRHAQPMTEPDHGADDRRGLRVAAEIHDEIAGDLDL